MRKDGASELLVILEGGIRIITENCYLRRMRTLIGDDKCKVGKKLIILLCDPKGTVLFLSERHSIFFESVCRSLKGQILLHGAHFFERIAIAFLNHLANLRRGCWHAGGALAYINTVGLQTFSFEVVGLVASLTDGNTHHPVILDRKAHEHCNVRHNSIADAVGDAGILLIHICQSDGISIVVNADEHHAAVRICESDHFFINYLSKLSLEFYIFGFKVHGDASSYEF